MGSKVGMLPRPPTTTADRRSRAPPTMAAQSSLAGAPLATSSQCSIFSSRALPALSASAAAPGAEWGQRRPGLVSSTQQGGHRHQPEHQPQGAGSP